MSAVARSRDPEPRNRQKSAAAPRERRPHLEIARCGAYLPQLRNGTQPELPIPARQYGEQNSKGSLEPGKLADLVILSANPVAVDPMAIKDIQVLETIKERETIYRR